MFDNYLDNSKFYYFISFTLIFFGFILKKLYVDYCNKITFDRLNKLFNKKLLWEKDLDIYSSAMPLFFTNVKRKKCILLISGYRDTPYVWSELIKYFKNEELDYYAPRTFGNGRTFFQDIDTKDWIITYIESLYILQEMYEEVNIISFSVGCVIALYISQFTYKCKINNIILCAPFLLKKKEMIDYFIDSKYSFIFKPILNFFLPYRIKCPEEGYKYPRDIHYEVNAYNDYYELVGIVKLDLELLNFKKIRPNIINANNIVIFNPNDDKIIGDIFEQQKIIMDIHKKIVPIITIPTFELFDELKKPILCGHSMFKEHPLIVKNIFDYLKKIIIDDDFEKIIFY